MSVNIWAQVGATTYTLVMEALYGTSNQLLGMNTAADALQYKDATFNNTTDQLAVPVGSAAAPSYTFTGDLDSGFYQDGADALGLAVGGSKVVGLSSSTLTSLVNVTLSGKLVQEDKGADITAATTTDLGTATGNYLVVTNAAGATTITGLGGATVPAGTMVETKFSITGGSVVLTHNATSMILLGGANITLVNGDIVRWRKINDAAAYWEMVGFQRGPSSSVLTARSLPTGRLSFATATPVMVSSVTGATSHYYVPYNGNTVYLYDGASWSQYTFSELSQTAADTTKSPAAVGNNLNYDSFVWNDAGTLRCTRGPDWSQGGGSATARGTGAGSTELEYVDGVLVNKYDITNGPLARRGLFVGSLRSNGTATFDWKLGSSAAGGGEAFLGVWNMYNRRDVAANVQDSTSSWTYSSTTKRPLNNSTTNRVSFICGLQEDAFQALASLYGSINASSEVSYYGIGLNSTTTPHAQNSRTLYAYDNSSPTVNGGMELRLGTTCLGFNYLQLLEWASGAVGVTTFYGEDGDYAAGWFNFKLMM